MPMDQWSPRHHIIDIGPEACLNGGQIVAEGEVREIIKNENSITGKYLSGKKQN